MNRAITALNRGYRALLRRLLGFRYAMLVLFFLGLGLTYWVYQRVPRGFVPDEDQGYIIVAVQAPQGASLEYTTKITQQVENEMSKMPEVTGIFAVNGFGFTGNASNGAVVYGALAPYSQRRSSQHSAASVIDRLRKPLEEISGAVVAPFAPPAVQGLGEFGGFRFELQDQGGHTLERLDQLTHAIVKEGNSRPELNGLFTTYSARDPQFMVTIDREKTKSLRVPLNQITDALQVYMGSVYVNDFDFNNRSYRVYIQADKAFRSQPRDIRQFYVRSDPGMMIPLDNLVQVTQTTSPPVISHYNLFRSAEIDGSGAPGYSSGEAIATMDGVAKKILPRGFNYAWTGLSLEELESGGKSAVLFALGVLVVYLTLAAQYESFSLPFIVLLAVPMALLGAIGAQWMRGLQNDVYCQIGMVMLIGLSSKNAILIVEFAEQLREHGRSVTEAAIEAAGIRLRPILMTSLAFILGVLPLVLARGAGELGRHSVGTTVFGGMIAATTLNLIFIPVLYVIVKGFRTKSAATKAPGTSSAQ